MKLAFHWSDGCFSSCLCDRDCVTCNYHQRGFVPSGCRGQAGNAGRGAGEGIASLGGSQNLSCESMLFFICPLKTKDTAGRGRVQRGTRVSLGRWNFRKRDIFDRGEHAATSKNSCDQFSRRKLLPRESWPLATYCHAIFTLYWLFVYFIVLKLEL